MNHFSYWIHTAVIATATGAGFWSINHENPFVGGFATAVWILAIIRLVTVHG